MPGHPSGTRAEPQDPQAQGLGFLGADPQKGWRVREKRGPTQVLILAHSHPPRQHSSPTDLRWNFDIFKKGTQNTRPLSVGHGADATCPRLEVELSLVSQICTCFLCIHLVSALDQEFSKEEDDITTFFCVSCRLLLHATFLPAALWAAGPRTGQILSLEAESEKCWPGGDACGDTTQETEAESLKRPLSSEPSSPACNHQPASG